MMRRLGLVIGFGLLLVVGLMLTLQSAQPVRAENLDVCPTCSYRTIQEAIDAAVGGDIIWVAQGVYSENIIVDKEVTLEGGYEDTNWARGITEHETVIDGGGTESVVKFIDGSDGAVLDGFTVQNGQGGYGGGVSIVRVKEVTIRNCNIVSNTAQDGGGGIGVKYAHAIVAANIILSNTVMECGGGGVYILSSVVTATNNMVGLNEGRIAWLGDGILVVGSSNVQIVNNTLVFNSAEGIEIHAGAMVLARNNIILGNAGGIHNFNQEGSISSDHNLFWDNGWNAGVSFGPGDITADPMFVDLLSNDYHLQAGSPCIDAGNNIGAPNTDFEGDPRPDGCFVDIGVDEYRGGRGCYRTYLPLVQG